MKEVKTGLGQKFDVKDLGQIKSFLGVQVDHDDQNLWEGQPGYTISFLERFGMRSAKPVSIPVDTSIKLKAGSESPQCDKGLYHSAVGSLLYLSNWTRPDITFAVNTKYTSNPHQ